MIIALASQKGGTGKTTTAAAVWAACPRSLAVDLDGQGNLSLITGANTEPERDIYDVLTGECNAQDAVQTLPAGELIAGTEALTGIGEIPSDALRRALEPIAQNYKHVVIDTPPYLNLLTINALVAADILVIPIQADIMSLQGLKQIKKMIDTVQEVNTTLRIGGILLTRYSPRSIVRRSMLDGVKEFAVNNGIHVFSATVREAVAVLEAQALHTDIFNYAPKAKVTQDYRDFVTELESEISNG